MSQQSHILDGLGLGRLEGLERPIPGLRWAHLVGSRMLYPAGATAGLVEQIDWQHFEQQIKVEQEKGWIVPGSVFVWGPEGEDFWRNTPVRRWRANLAAAWGVRVLRRHFPDALILDYHQVVHGNRPGYAAEIVGLFDGVTADAYLPNPPQKMGWPDVWTRIDHVVAALNRGPEGTQRWLWLWELTYDLQPIPQTELDAIVGYVEHLVAAGRLDGWIAYGQAGIPVGPETPMVRAIARVLREGE